MEKFTESDWIKLAKVKIFFGHQSVGNNIIDGLVELKNKSNSSEFIIQKTKDISDFKYPMFAHSEIGNNYDPKSKIDEFTRILNGGLADSLDIAFMKFCYVDINRRTNIKELSKYYQSSINSLQEKYPHLKFIHCTVPLVIKPKGVKGLIKKILKMDDNPYRNGYNELMRNEYADNELFDIAKIEATFPDNTFNIYGSNKIQGLISDYSSDGGHLNQQGRFLVAHELMSKLLVLIASSN